MEPFFSNLLHFRTEFNHIKLRPIKGWSFAEKEQRANN